MIGITGSRGVLGTAIQRVLASRHSAFEDDVRDSNAVEEWVRSSGVSSILHFAAVVPVRKVEADPKLAFDVNVGGTLNLCEAIRKSQRDIWLFVASTSHVYAPSQIALAENVHTDPRSLYGFTKLEAERVAKNWSRRTPFPLCIGRIFSFSAKTQSDDYVLPALVRRIREAPTDTTLRINGGKQTRDFMTTSQIAKAIAFLAERRAVGIFNIASGKGSRIIDLAASLARRLQRDDLKFVSEDDDDHALVADTTKISTLGFVPQPDVDDVLAELTEP